MSALATIFGSLGELSELELRQLYLAIGVRLNISDVPSGSKAREKGSGKSGNTKSKGGKTSSSKSSSKGNPMRKSQWANHPLYQEYSRLKKVVEAQAKESKLSFNEVRTGEARAYREAFSQWLEAKSSFRDHRESGPSGNPDEKEEDSEEESEVAPQPKAAPQPKESKTPSPPKPIPASTGQSSSSQATLVKGKGKAPAK